MEPVAVLFTDLESVYDSIEGVETWNVEDDARSYAGPYPVVAHPPCASWSILAPLRQARWGKKIGDDGGCFESALNSVRKFGGVLEHPRFSFAWNHFGLPDVGHTDQFGFTLGVQQSDFGHLAQKATWLYIVGVHPLDLPLMPLRLGDVEYVVQSRSPDRKHVPKWMRTATPRMFAEWLVEVARRSDVKETIG